MDTIQDNINDSTTNLAYDPRNLSSYNLLSEKCQKANTNLVLPSCVKPTKLCIVGESLGKEENENCAYFIGKAGMLLDKLLSEVGLIRSTMYITNVIKIQPPGNKVERLEELGLTINDFIPYLEEELKKVNPYIILALGKYAMEALTNLKGILNQRGSVVDCKIPGVSAKVMLTLHPSYLQRGNMNLYPYVRHDIKRFAEIGFGLKTNSLEDELQMLVDPTFTECMNFLTSIYESSTSTCFDIETFNKQIITCIGWTKNENSAICIPFRYKGLKNRWTKPEQLMLLNLMRKIYQKSSITKIAQNMHYDMHFLLPLLGYPSHPHFDTMYAHALIHPDARHDLGFIMSVYTDMNYHKEDVKDWSKKNLPKDQVLWTYNCKDAIGTHRSYLNLKRDLKDYNLYDFFTGYIMPLRRALFQMEHEGIKVDTKLMSEWREFIEKEQLPIAQDILNKMAKREINPNSSKQVGQLLADLGLPVPLTEKGNFKVNEETLEDFEARFPRFRKLLAQILCVRTLKSKDLGTYLSAKLSPDGRMKTSYGLTNTGRLSSKANEKDEGTNIQNIPKYLRTIFIPDDGDVFLDPDLAQAEAFVIVYQMKAEKLKARMNKGEKIHAVVAEWVHHKKISELTDSQYRDIKATVYGSNYRMGIRKFAKQVKKPVEQARKLMSDYFRVVPQLPAYHQWVENTIRKERQITTFYGRKRIITGKIDSKTLYSFYAQIPQSTVADTINLALLGIWLIKPSYVKLRAQVHDELLISLPPDKVEFFKPYIIYHMQTLREITIHDDILAIPVDMGKTKTNWYGK